MHLLKNAFTTPCKIGSKRGFTLIELSIVLVVIGLLVGSVLVGQNLITAAAMRAQITQIEQFRRAANTFYGKYGSLPGDITAAAAAQFGFAARGSYAGEGDGNGLIEGVDSNSANSNSGLYEAAGETVMFWQDLAVNGLIAGSYSLSSATTSFPSASLTPVSVPGLSSYFPVSKIQPDNYIQVFSFNGLNYFSLSAVSVVYYGGVVAASATLPVNAAYYIDKKIDDGLPQSGTVTATYSNGGGVGWASGGTGQGAHGSLTSNGPAGYATSTNATPGSSVTCYDNNSNPGAAQQYSVEQYGGLGQNCALSFRMQAGD